MSKRIGNNPNARIFEFYGYWGLSYNAHNGGPTWHRSSSDSHIDLPPAIEVAIRMAHVAARDYTELK